MMITKYEEAILRRKQTAAQQLEICNNFSITYQIPIYYFCHRNDHWSAGLCGWGVPGSKPSACYVYFCIVLLFFYGLYFQKKFTPLKNNDSLKIYKLMWNVIFRLKLESALHAPGIVQEKGRYRSPFYTSYLMLSWEENGLCYYLRRDALISVSLFISLPTSFMVC